MNRPLAWLESALRDLADAGHLRQRRIVRPCGKSRCEVDGRPAIDFASNDYLGLAGDARLVNAARAALDDSGTGARASALVCGRMPWHDALERQIAAFENQPQAVLFPTGMAANVGTIVALCRPNDLILCDRLNHASLVDGCRLSGARLRVYRHDDLDGLRRTIQREHSPGAGRRAHGPPAQQGGRTWIITDGVFSMDGDQAPLAELCALAESCEAGVIVDEAHGTGVLGHRGRGACEVQGVEDRVAVRIGTLSKALGVQGGFVAGSPSLVNYLWNTARTQIYSTALSPPLCAAAVEALKIVETEPQRRVRLAELGQYARQSLREAGAMILPVSTTPILPVLLPDATAAVGLADRLLHRGILVGAIRPPTVPRGTSRLRIVIHSDHSESDLDQLAAAIREELPRV